MSRNQEIDVAGIFPVTGISQRQATDMLWLMLERSDGTMSRMGVTSEHSLFTEGEGWLTAGELVPGDAIRDSGLRELTILAVEVDNAPQIVHNLEVADAHTYFAGELEAWGHNVTPTTPTTVYKLLDRTTKRLLKNGITCNPKRRYSGPALDRMNADLVSGPVLPRAQALLLARFMTRTCPGPLNRERWAGKGIPD